MNFQVDGTIMNATATATDQIVWGDNLKVLEGLPDGCVDLIYADPPYYTQRDWQEFNDRWPDLDFYITYMEDRMMECHRVLKDTGSLYLQCDPTASHYLKVMLDRVFGRTHFRNEVAWCYAGGGVSKKWFARKHDVILFYTKSDDYFFNLQYVPYHPSWRFHFDGSEVPVERGKHLEDWWIDIPSFHMTDRPEFPYPTQKPVKLLERIVLASSKQGHLVLDPFCGSGTSMVAALKHNRHYLGIDQNQEAVAISKARLANVEPVLPMF